MSNVTQSAWGATRPDDRNSLTAGPGGPVLLDIHYIDKIQHFDRERVPERVVHANGVGARGYFEVTDDISSHCKAALFSKVGNRVKAFVRFSNVTGERGAADTERDPRGFAIKFYTEEGNWDLVCNNVPVFFVRDPMLFPDLIHAVKRNPKTDLRDPTDFWSFMANTPEAVHVLMMVMGDRGIPASYRHMNGYGNHTFRLVNSDGKGIWCKFHVKAEGGVKNLTSEAAEAMRGVDTDYLKRDLTDYISAGGKAVYNMFVQLIPEEDVDKLPYNIFDVTKVVPHGDYPLQRVGRLVLDNMPDNYFEETEQVAFCPANLVPGIDFSPDRVLQGRLLSYKDTQVHRLGVNFHQLAVNRTMCPVFNQNRDGLMRENNFGAAPNFYPGSAVEPGQAAKDANVGGFNTSGGVVGRYDQRPDDPDADFVQPRALYEKVMTPEERDRLAQNLIGFMKLARPDVQERQLENFRKVSEDLYNRCKAYQRLVEGGVSITSGGKEPSDVRPALWERTYKQGNTIVDAPPRYKEQTMEDKVNEGPGGETNKFAYGKDAAGPTLLGTMRAAAKNTMDAVVHTVRSAVHA